MPSVFVAKSESLQSWASDVGLTAHVYKLGLGEEGDEAWLAAALDAQAHAGRRDWQVLAVQEASEGAEEEALVRRAAGKESLVDPLYYPQIRRAPGIFKVKLLNVENHYMVREALEGQQIKRIKITPAHIAAYLLRLATG